MLGVIQAWDLPRYVGSEKVIHVAENENESMPLLPGANGVLESIIDASAKELEMFLDADVITYRGSMSPPIDEYIRFVIESRAQRRDKLVFLLTTNGGQLDVVDRIVTTLRHHYPECVDFIIPNYAFSAGTVLALSGDDIHMDYFSVLGPIDPQDILPDGRMVPALGYVQRYNDLIKKSEVGELTTAEMTLLVTVFDQGKLYMYEHAKELSKAFIRDWLVKYKFKDWSVTETLRVPVTDEMKTTRADEIAECLSDTDRWHSHGRGISRDMLERDLNLKIKDFGADKLLDPLIKNYYRLLSDYCQKMGSRAQVHVPGRLMML
jgi:Serine dehydrogenase proteinase